MTRANTSRSIFTKYIKWFLIYLPFIFLSCAPASVPNSTGISPSIRTNAHAVVTPKTWIKSYRRVAVLPFKAPVELVGASVADTWTTEMLATGRYEVIERSQVEKILREQALGLKGVISTGDAVKVGQILGVKAVVVGTISEYGYHAVGSQKLPSIGFNVRMLDVEDGGIIWSVSNSAMASSPTSLSLFTQQLIIASINALKKEWKRYGSKTTRMLYLPKSYECLTVDSKSFIDIHDKTAGVTVHIRTIFGVGITDKNKAGPVVMKIIKETPAAISGIQVNDIILGIDNIPTSDGITFMELFKKYLLPNQETVLNILRNGVRFNIPVRFSGRIKQVEFDSNRARVMLWGKKIGLNLYSIQSRGCKLCRSEHQVIKIKISGSNAKKQAIRWHYQFIKKGYAYLGIVIDRLNASAFRAFTFKIKNAKRHGTCKLYCYMFTKVKNSNGKFGSKYFTVTNHWKKIQIPLSEFKNGRKRPNLSKITAVGFYTGGKNVNNSIFIADVGFKK